MNKWLIFYEPTNKTIFLQGGVEADVPSDEKGAHYKNVQSNIAAGSGGGGLVSNGNIKLWLPWYVH